MGSELDNSDSVVCHTDLNTCCSGGQNGQGPHRGSWYFPAGTMLPFASSSVPIGLGRTAQIAVIRRTGGATEPTGIYRCRIATNAVHDDTDESVGETVYVGLYPDDGMYILKFAYQIQTTYTQVEISQYQEKLHLTLTR